MPGFVHFREDPLVPKQTGRASVLLLVLSAPVIYGLVIPLALLDLCASLYQRICFPIYRIALVPRAEHLVFDRMRLPYLNRRQRFNCAYCSYANGVLAYVSAIAAATERYWCPIRHADSRHEGQATDDYVAFGDEEGWRKNRAEMIQCPDRREGQGKASQ